MILNILDNDTIAAISSAPGKGAIAIVRLSGSNSLDIADKVFSSFSKKENIKIDIRKSIYGKITTKQGEILDEVIAVSYKAPSSFTGEDMVEFYCHGSIYIQQELLKLLIYNGARIAKNGEFSQRAYLNQKLDLSQAESIADLIDSESRSQHKMAIQQLKGSYSKEFDLLRLRMLNFASLIELELDFSEEDVEFANREELLRLVNEIDAKVQKLIDSFRLGNAIKKGIPIAIAGVTNAGKSTLLNNILGEDKAIVSDIHGTTRDTIEDTLNINGVLFRFVDTAGLRDTDDTIESIGIERSYRAIENASIVLIIMDISRKDDIEQINLIKDILHRTEDKNRILLLNKIDNLSSWSDYIYNEVKTIIGKDLLENVNINAISAKESINIDELLKAISDIYLQDMDNNADIIISNVRHFELLKKVSNALNAIKEAMDMNIHTDLLAQDMRLAISYIGEITGQEISSDNILHNIFQHFCIGK